MPRLRGVPRSLARLMRRSRLWVLLLVPGGLGAGHAIGYGAAAAVGALPVTTGGHSYVGALLRLAIPFSLAVLGRALHAGMRSELPPVRAGHLASLQLGLYLLIEVAEHAAAGVAVLEALTQPSTLLGALAQVLVAWALCAAVRAATRAGCRIAHRRPTPRMRVTPPTLIDRLSAVRRVALCSISERGPPALPA